MFHPSLPSGLSVWGALPKYKHNQTPTKRGLMDKTKKTLATIGILILVVAITAICTLAIKYFVDRQKQIPVTPVTEVSEEEIEETTAAMDHDAVERAAADELKELYRSGEWDGTVIVKANRSWEVTPDGVLRYSGEDGERHFGYAAYDIDTMDVKVLNTITVGGTKLAAAIKAPKGAEIWVFGHGDLLNKIAIKTGDEYQFNSRCRLFQYENIVVLRQGEYVVSIDWFHGEVVDYNCTCSDVQYDLNQKVTGEIFVATYYGENFVVTDAGHFKLIDSHWHKLPVVYDLTTPSIESGIKVIPRGREQYAGDGMDDTWYRAYTNDDQETFTLIRFDDGKATAVVATDVVDFEATTGCCYVLRSNGKSYIHHGDEGLTENFTSVKVLGYTEFYSEEDVILAITTTECSNWAEPNGWRNTFNPIQPR